MSKLIEPIKPENEWRRLDQPTPYPVVQGIAFDISGKFLVIHRTEKVRSAKNCWSLPSGLHECGFTFAQQFANELREEFSLVGIAETGKIIGIPYENILPGDDFHWVICGMIMQVESFAVIQNNEVEKHDDFKIVPLNHLIDESSWLWKLRFEPRLLTWLRTYGHVIHKEIWNTLNPNTQL